MSGQNGYNKNKNKNKNKNNNNNINHFAPARDHYERTKSFFSFSAAPRSSPQIFKLQLYYMFLMYIQRASYSWITLDTSLLVQLHMSNPGFEHECTRIRTQLDGAAIVIVQLYIIVQQPDTQPGCIRSPNHLFQGRKLSLLELLLLLMLLARSSWSKQLMVVNSYSVGTSR